MIALDAAAQQHTNTSRCVPDETAVNQQIQRAAGWMRRNTIKGCGSRRESRRPRRHFMRPSSWRSQPGERTLCPHPIPDSLSAAIFIDSARGALAVVMLIPPSIALPRAKRCLGESYGRTSAPECCNPVPPARKIFRHVASGGKPSSDDLAAPRGYHMEGRVNHALLTGDSCSPIRMRAR